MSVRCEVAPATLISAIPVRFLTARAGARGRDAGPADQEASIKAVS